MIVKFWLRKLTNKFIKEIDKDKKNRFLEKIYRISNQKHIPLFSDNKEAIISLLKLDLWKLSDEIKVECFFIIERNLFDYPLHFENKDWQAWLKNCRLAEHRINVHEKMVSYALNQAYENGKFSEANHQDLDYLLQSYLRIYRELVEQIDINDTNFSLDVLLNYISLVHFGNEKSDFEIIKKWSQNKLNHPRALSSLKLKEIINAPIKGVASPNEICMTIYHSPQSTYPVNISFAGMTGDPVLNTNIFTCFYAAALASDTEPTFIISSGASLSISPKRQIENIKKGPKLLDAVIGQNGLIEPKPGIPSVGLAPEDAMLLVSENFERLQEETGLVQVSKWRIEDTTEFEKKILTKLNDKGNKDIHIIRSDPEHYDQSGIIHYMQLFYRNVCGDIQPIEIDISLKQIGYINLYKMLNKLRHHHMQQLIEAGERRRAFAQGVYLKEKEIVENWQKKTPEEKAKICKKYPKVTINQFYDFILGILKVNNPPEVIDRMIFEEQYRPQNRNSAKNYMDRFKELCNKLNQINESEGKADIISLKLLLDSMIRQAQIWINDEEFQKLYKDWVTQTSTPTWLIITKWATDNNFPIHILAGDNIVFNSRIDKQNEKIIIEPFVAIDLNNFFIKIDSDKGIFECNLGENTKSLNDIFIPNENLEIKNIDGLQNVFFNWLESNFSFSNIIDKETIAAQDFLKNDIKIYSLVMVEVGKQMIFKGKIDEAINVFNEIRKYDLAPIYFWGAVAYQYKYLNKYFKSTIIRENDDVSTTIDKMINYTFDTLIEHIRFTYNPNIKENEISETEIIEIAKNVGFNSNLINSSSFLNLVKTFNKKQVHVDDEAKKFIEQLAAKDRFFIAGLMEPKPNISELENKSLTMTDEEEKKLHAAIYGLSSLEFMDLATNMNEIANNLSFEFNIYKNLKDVIKEILNNLDEIIIKQPDCADQIKELEKII